MGVGERIKTLVAGGSADAGANASQSPAADSSRSEAMPSLTSLAKDARSAGKRTKRAASIIENDRARIEAAQELEDLWTREQWEEISSWYFDIRFVMTGWEGFRLDDKENAKLGLTFAKTMKILLKINPEYIAMILFFGNFSSLITKKEAQYYRLRKLDEQRRAGPLVLYALRQADGVTR